MEATVIASGSNGNCCLVSEKETSVLVDAGKSGIEIQRRMEALGKSIEDLNAILITHSHSDHISGAGVLSRRLGIPVYMSAQTAKESRIGNARIVEFYPKNEIRIGSIKAKPLRTSHSVESCGFVFNKKFGIMTDTGKTTQEMTDAVKNLKGVLIESNHDIDMLVRGPYPAYLKQWVMSSEGHLSNIDASMLLQKHGKNISTAILGHMSGNNNTPEIVLSTFNCIVKRKIDAFVADREKPTGTFEF